MMTRAHIITGSFGAGKTTAIRRLMTEKPPQELWVVILNEFTDAGVDALTVAESARGQYDVRLVAGGCLCCVGELEFGKQVRDILRMLKPTRLLIEPSGAGHAADIVDELSIYEAQKALTLDSVVCLVDPRDAMRLSLTRAGNDWSQIQSADVLLMSKNDLATDEERAAFMEIAEAQFPAKRHVGVCSGGELPAEALHAYSRPARFSLVADRSAHDAETEPFEIGGLPGTESSWRQLDLHARSWILPTGLTFSRAVLEPRLRWLTEAYAGYLRRMKAVFRTGPGPSWAVQSAGHGLSAEDSAYRRDSRLEIVCSAAPTEAFLGEWRDTLRAAVAATAT